MSRPKKATDATISDAQALLAGDLPSSAAIREKLGEMRDQREAALAAIAEAEAHEQANVLSLSAEALAENDEHVTRLRRQIALLERLDPIACEKLKQAEYREDQKDRLAKRREAEELLAESEAWIAGRYVELATELRAGLLRMREIYAKIRAADERRPDGYSWLTFEAGRRDPKAQYHYPYLHDSVRLPGPVYGRSYWDKDQSPP